MTEREQTKEYKNGYDSVINGADMTNCHFSNFTSKEKTTEWERGRDAAEIQREVSDD